jgi:V8-like Glu-specific endopeptidase
MTASLRDLVSSPVGAGCASCPGCACRGGLGPGAGEYIIIGGSDQRRRVHQTTRPPYRYICNLEYDGWPRVTGTLIGPRTVLTAGHCLHQPGSSVRRVPSLMRVVPGRNGPSEPLPATRAVHFEPYPGYRAGTQTDLGIIHLANPIGNRIGWWGRRDIPFRDDPRGTSIAGIPASTGGTLHVRLSGYPKDMPNTPGLHCRRPSGVPCAHSALGPPPRNKARCGTEQWKSKDVVASLADPGMIRYLNDTCPGHSGSPVWLTRTRAGGGRVLVGVHVGASPGGASNRAARIRPAVLQWIRANYR